MGMIHLNMELRRIKSRQESGLARERLMTTETILRGSMMMIWT